MSDVEVEIEEQQEQVYVYEGFTKLPSDVVAESGSIKLFNKWSFDDVEVKDISLTDYIHDPAQTIYFPAASTFTDLSKSHDPFIHWNIIFIFLHSSPLYRQYM